MGLIHIRYDWDWEAADTSLRRALDLEPGSAQVLNNISFQATILGRWSEAIDLANKAIERDPLRPNYYKADRLMRKLVDDLRYKALLRKLKLPG